MTDWQRQLPESARKALKRRSMPRWTQPMLATLTEERFSSADWLYERKLDGERCLAFIRKSQVRILSRNRKTLNSTYPELIDALGGQTVDHAILDGEIVAFEGGLTSFSRLQGRLGIHDADQARASGIAVFLYLFDLLHLDGYDTTALPLRDRKQLLRRRLSFDDPLRLTTHRNEDGVEFYEQACKQGWEGIIAKRADSEYRHGRSRDWLKFKCVNQQELVICGFTEPSGSREAFGALLLGYYEDGELRYAGKVGTGFDSDRLRSLGSRLRSLRRKTTPCTDAPRTGGETHWVRPKLVAEIGFTEWTRAGRLRHPRFLGLRDDKDAEDVVREKPA